MSKVDDRIKKFKMEAKLLETKYDGKDGRPKFVIENVIAKMGETGERSAGKAFKSLHPEALNDYVPQDWEDPNKLEKITSDNLFAKTRETLYGETLDTSTADGVVPLVASGAPDQGDRSIHIEKILDEDGKVVTQGKNKIPVVKISESAYDFEDDLSQKITEHNETERNTPDEK